MAKLYHVVQYDGTQRIQIGEMSETEMYGHVGTRAGGWRVSEALLEELREKETAEVEFTNSCGLLSRIVVHRI